VAQSLFMAMCCGNVSSLAFCDDEPPCIVKQCVHCNAGIDKQPQLWHNPWAGLYVVAVCFFLGLFWVNLLQGAIIDNYCRLIEEMGTGALVSAMLCCAMLCCAVPFVV